MVKEEFIFNKSEKYPSCHCATIVELKSKDLFSAWYAGSYEKAKDVVILFSRFSQKEKKWSREEILVDTKGFSEGNPVLFVSPENELYLFYATIFGNEWAEAKLRYRKSKDEGVTWSEDKWLREKPGSMVKNKVVVLKNGEFLIPCYDDENGDVFVLITKDFEKYQEFKVPSSPGIYILQPAVIQKEDGTLLMYLRTANKYIYKSTSSDNGRTWSLPSPTIFPNPNSGIDLLKTRSGNLLLVYNHSSIKRTPLNIALSEDEGETWKSNKILEDGPGEFSYPQIIQTSDNLIHIVYTYKREKIKHVILEENYLKKQF
jgi:alpha-L-rhamnosidase